MCVLSVACGFLGATAAVVAFPDQFRGESGVAGDEGPPGPTGQTGPEGPPGPPGQSESGIEELEGAFVISDFLCPPGASGFTTEQVVTDVSVSPFPDPRGLPQLDVETARLCEIE